LAQFRPGAGDVIQSPLPFDAPLPDYPPVPKETPSVGGGAGRPFAQRDPSLARGSPEIVFIRHPRARRYVLRVRDDGVVRVTIPRGGSKRDARAFVERERSWVAEQVVRAENPVGRRPSSDPDVRALRNRARQELVPRLLELAATHGLSVSRVSIRNQRWRWGSCSSSGLICLNWRLMQMPTWVRDYVMVHELMHLKRLDHSPAFWKLVAAACPKYREARAWLRELVGHMPSSA
jgi:hypothetical protein